MKSPRIVGHSFVFTVLVGASLAGLAALALAGCELAVNPDVGLAEVPAPVCIPCLDAADTVITEPDGNVLIVPIASLDGGGDDDDDEDAQSADSATGSTTDSGGVVADQ